MEFIERAQMQTPSNKNNTLKVFKELYQHKLPCHALLKELDRRKITKYTKSKEKVKRKIHYIQS
jgi:hypothetical protein